MLAARADAQAVQKAQRADIGVLHGIERQQHGTVPHGREQHHQSFQKRLHALQRRHGARRRRRQPGGFRQQGRKLAQAGGVQVAGKVVAPSISTAARGAGIRLANGDAASMARLRRLASPGCRQHEPPRRAGVTCRRLRGRTSRPPPAFSTAVTTCCRRVCTSQESAGKRDEGFSKKHPMRSGSVGPPPPSLSPAPRCFRAWRAVACRGGSSIIHSIARARFDTPGIGSSTATPETRSMDHGGTVRVSSE